MIFLVFKVFCSYIHQVDYEQCKEECEYFRHKTSELEHLLNDERKLKQEAEQKSQV